jgi:hypothetical protein
MTLDGISRPTSLRPAAAPQKRLAAARGAGAGKHKLLWVKFSTSRRFRVAMFLEQLEFRALAV